MPDPVAIVPTEQSGALDAGTTTSEYAATKWTVILSIAAVVVGAIADVLAELAPQFSGLKWYGIAVTVVGLIVSVLATLGYTRNRTALKIAALQKPK